MLNYSENFHISAPRRSHILESGLAEVAEAFKHAASASIGAPIISLIE